MCKNESVRLRCLQAADLVRAIHVYDSGVVVPKNPHGRGVNSQARHGVLAGRCAMYVRGHCATDANTDTTPWLLLVLHGPQEVSNNILVASPPTEPRNDKPA